MKKFRPKFSFDEALWADPPCDIIEPPHEDESVYPAPPCNVVEVVEIKDCITYISIYEKTVAGEIKFVTKVIRYYQKGGSYEEPEHIWNNQHEARLDLKDWKSLSKMNDW